MSWDLFNFFFVLIVWCWVLRVRLSGSLLFGAWGGNQLLFGLKGGSLGRAVSLWNWGVLFCWICRGICHSLSCWVSPFVSSRACAAFKWVLERFVTKALSFSAFFSVLPFVTSIFSSFCLVPWWVPSVGVKIPCHVRVESVWRVFIWRAISVVGVVLSVRGEVVIVGWVVASVGGVVVSVGGVVITVVTSVGGGLRLGGVVTSSN